MNIVKWLNKHLEEYFLVLMLVLIACVSMAQVIIRKVPGMASLTWAEEFCRFLWVWSVFISLPYTIKMENMLRVGVLKDMLPEKVKKVVNILVDLVTLASMSYLGYYSLELLDTIKRSGEPSPAMQWPMWLVYLFMVIGFILGSCRALQVIYLHIKNFNEKELSTIEQTMQEAAKEAEMAKGDEA